MLPCVYLVRHGETAWSASGRHTGRTDIPLTEGGERKARALGDRLKGVMFDRVFTSPLQRAARTCSLAGFGATAKVDPDLLEWDYGDYEGRSPARSSRTAPAGSCSGTDAQTVSCLRAWASGLTASSPAFARWTTARSCFRAATS